MRKLLRIAVFSCLVVITANCQAGLVLTGIIDGGLTGGLPKAIELYATADIADLSVYSIDNANNGGAFDGTAIGLSGSVTAGSYLYVASENTGFTSYFSFAPNFTGNSLNVNGNDVVGLFENGSLIDVYGVLGEDGVGQPWEYLDGWAYRLDDTLPSATFNLADWSLSALNVTDGTTTVGQTGFPFGTYTLTAIPEPSTYGVLTIIGLTGIAYRRRKQKV